MQRETYRLQELVNIKTLFEGLEAKEKEHYSKKEAVVYLRDTIKNLIEKNYSVEEISQLLASKNFTIAASTLKKWIGEGGNNNPTKSKPSKNITKLKKNLEKKSDVLSTNEHELSESVETLIVEEPNVTEEIALETEEQKEEEKEEQKNSSARFKIKEDTPL